MLIWFVAKKKTHSEFYVYKNRGERRSCNGRRHIYLEVVDVLCNHIEKLLKNEQHLKAI